jgi:glucose/arabinose dehydrogenase
VTTRAQNPPAVVETTAEPPALTFWDCTASPSNCPDDVEQWSVRLSVPSGFRVSVLARVPPDYSPTALAYGPDRRLYVALVPRPFSEGFGGAIYTLSEAGDWQLFSDGWWLPTGLTFGPNDQTLYVSSRAGRFAGQIAAVTPDDHVTPIVADLPCCYSAGEHQPNGLVFGPDGWLYVAIGARSDHGEPAWGETEARIDPL